MPELEPDVAVAVTPGLSQVERVIDTYIAPSKTFTDILRNQSWWLPFLLSLVVGYVFVFAMQSKVGWEKITENAMKQNPAQAEQLASMTPQQLAFAAKFTMGISYSIPVLVLLFVAIFALVLWGTINFGFGGKATYGQVFCVWMYAGLPLMIKSLLGIVALFAGMDAESFNPQNPVGTNIGYFLPPDLPKWLIALGTSLDFFSIWWLVLAGIGIAIVAKVKRSSGLIAVFGWWVLITLITVGIAAAKG